MLRNASKAIKKILKHEGGYVNHPIDPAGATNKGITIATYRRFIKRSGTIADLKSLTVEEATIVYKKRYWDAVMADYLPSGIDYAVADYAVNSGPSRAAKYLQRIVGASEDGKIGPATLTLVKAMPPDVVVGRLCDDRLAFMRRLKTWPTFGKGWSRRVSDVRSVSLSWVLSEIDRKPAKTAPETPLPIDLGYEAQETDNGEDGRSMGLWEALVILFKSILSIFGGRK